MVPIEVRDGLLFVSVVVHVGMQSLTIKHVLLDTGSETTLFDTDDLTSIGVTLPLDGIIGRVFGIGSSSEWVIATQVDRLVIGDLIAAPFTIELGSVDYGEGINGIIGSDFLLKTGAVLDLKRLELRQG